METDKTVNRQISKIISDSQKYGENKMVLCEKTEGSSLNWVT